MPSPFRLTRAKSAPTPTSGAQPMPEAHSPAPRLSRLPSSVRRVMLLIGVVVAVIGLPGTAQAAASPAASATMSAGAPSTAVHVAAGAPTLVSQPAGPASVTGR